MKYDLNQIDKIPQILKEMFDRDQDMLKNRFNLSLEEQNKQFQGINKENCEIMRQMVEKYGVISISKFGEKASHNAWLLILHFPKEEVSFMEKYLNLMKEHSKDVIPRNIAYLEDRVNIYNGKLQKYGTQYRKNETTGKFETHSLENIAEIDKNRAEVGLDTLQEYLDLANNDS